MYIEGEEKNGGGDVTSSEGEESVSDELELEEELEEYFLVCLDVF